MGLSYGTTTLHQATKGIVQDGLVLNLDAGVRDSYDSGTTWRDLKGNYDFSLINSPVFGKHNGCPCFTFSGSNDYAYRNASISHDIGSSCTLCVMMASVNGANFGTCSRLFSVGNSSSSNNDYHSFFTTASCNQSKFGLWYKNSPANFYATTNQKTASDTYIYMTYKWTASSNAYILVNGVQSASSSITSAFDYTQVAKIAIGVNGGSLGENSTVRVALVHMYDRELSTNEVARNFNAVRHRFGI
jgi:hypothetical protein